GSGDAFLFDLNSLYRLEISGRGRQIAAMGFFRAQSWHKTVRSRFRPVKVETPSVPMAAARAAAGGSSAELGA
ncbi:MAG: hypothetical protein KGN84_10240, partial [Acidobacteriota bacterium]|nr:hypothetical protein [Acidobacteriota bacterium]